jgi:hypothetical protein
MLYSITSRNQQGLLQALLTTGYTVEQALVTSISYTVEQALLTFIGYIVEQALLIFTKSTRLALQCNQ